MESLYFRFRQAIGDLIYEATDETRHTEVNLASFIKVTTEVMEHGFKSNGTIFKRGRSLWEFIAIAFNEPVIIETVLNLSEQDPSQRVSLFLKMALLQQSLTQNLTILYGNEEIVSEWFLDTALMRNSEMRNSIIEITKSLQKIEFNIDIQPVTRPELLPKMPDLKYFGTITGSIKSGFSHTYDTIGKVQSQIVDTAKSGMDIISGSENPQSPTPATGYVEKVELEKLQAQLNTEMAEKIKAKLGRDRIKRTFGEEIARLESILKFHNIEFDSMLNSLMSD